MATYRCGIKAAEPIWTSSEHLYVQTDLTHQQILITYAIISYNKKVLMFSSLSCQFLCQSTAKQSVAGARNSRCWKDVFVAIQVALGLLARRLGQVKGRAASVADASLCALLQGLKHDIIITFCQYLDEKNLSLDCWQTHLLRQKG